MYLLANPLDNNIMLKQLLLCKRLFNEGMNFAKRSDSVSNGIAISLFQDSVEICVWAIIKDKNIQVKDGAPFTGYIEAIQKAGFTLPQVAKINELNKARVNFSKCSRGTYGVFAIARHYH